MTVIVTHSGSDGSIEYIAEAGSHFPGTDFQKVDVESESDVQKFFSYVEQQYGRIDILCLLAGGVSPKRWIEDVTFDEWKSVFSLNLHSCFLMMRDAMRMMKKNRYGRIITITAKPAVIPEGKRGGYGVSKAGVISLTRSVAEEVKEFGDITVNSIAPGIILTEKNKEWGNEEEMKKWTPPGHIAEMIMVLCSDSSSSVNGEIIQMFGKV
jgi:NAD(P)-dependent dehydrogenase (short-subunit alcohol dehydrogenase family)